MEAGENADRFQRMTEQMEKLRAQVAMLSELAEGVDLHAIIVE